MVKRSDLFVGVDVSRRSLHVAAVNGRGEIVLSEPVANDQAALGALVRTMGLRKQPTVWAVDMNGGPAALVIALLRSRGCDVRYVPAGIAAHVGAAVHGERKTDARDAVAIAQALRIRPDLPSVGDVDPLRVRLEVLTVRRRNLVRDRVRILMRIQALVATVCPALLPVLDVTRLGPLWILTRWQTPAMLRSAGPRRVQRLLWEHRIQYSADLASAVVAAARLQWLPVAGEEAYATAIAELAVDAIELRALIKVQEERIGVAVARHRLTPIISSMIGMGPVLTAELIAIAGDFSGYANADRLAGHAGLAPVEHDSGQIGGVQRRPVRYHRGLRRVFTQSSFVAMQFCPTSRIYTTVNAQRAVVTNRRSRLCRDIAPG